MAPNIFYLSAYSTTKHYGQALNKHIELLPEDCYIVLTDGDTCFLTPDYGTIIEQAIVDNPQAELMTCRTNRAYGQGYDEQTDMVKHYEKAMRLQSGAVRYTATAKVLPAFLWIFPKKTWLNNRFDEHPIIHHFNSFDTRFCKKLRGKRLIIEHLYVFHYYRLHDKNKKINHLV